MAVAPLNLAPLNDYIISFSTIYLDYDDENASHAPILLGNNTNETIKYSVRCTHAQRYYVGGHGDLEPKSQKNVTVKLNKKRCPDTTPFEDVFQISFTREIPNDKVVLKKEKIPCYVYSSSKGEKPQEPSTSSKEVISARLTTMPATISAPSPTITPPPPSVPSAPTPPLPQRSTTPPEDTRPVVPISNSNPVNPFPTPAVTSAPVNIIAKNLNSKKKVDATVRRKNPLLKLLPLIIAFAMIYTLSRLSSDACVVTNKVSTIANAEEANEKLSADLRSILAVLIPHQEYIVLISFGAGCIATWLFAIM